MAACTDDQLDWLSSRAWTEPEWLTQPVHRALFVLFDTLSPSERVAALGKGGLNLSRLSSEQLRLLMTRSNGLERIGQKAIKHPDKVKMFVRETIVGKQRTVKFLFDWGSSTTPVILRLLP